jgi:hypothetical protein
VKTNIYLRILVGTAVVGLTFAYTVARLLGKGHPLEPVNLGLIAIAALCLLFLIYPAVLGRLHSIEGAGIKIELLEERQKQQQLQLDEFALILPIFLLLSNVSTCSISPQEGPRVTLATIRYASNFAGFALSDSFTIRRRLAISLTDVRLFN